MKEAAVPAKKISCEEALNMARQELAAFFRAVTELFGAEQAEAAAEDWLQQLLSRNDLPSSPREWRQITAKASVWLADRMRTSPAAVFEHLASDLVRDHP